MEQLHLPMSYDDMIPEKHLVRVVNQVINELDLTTLYTRYSEKGCTAYHPQMMLKVILYAYTQRIFTSRMIAKALRENIYFMWISGSNQPNWRTINRFRGEMKETIGKIFAEVIKLLIKNRYIRMENYFIDGTKIEANANKYTFVWNKSIRYYERQLDEKIRKQLEEIEILEEEEQEIYQEEDLEEIGEKSRLTAAQVERAAAVIDKRIEAEPENKELKKKRKMFRADFIPRKIKYEKALETFRGRNSYSKTDPDATFMRMKEDAMLNGQLKPGYNIQMGTENRYIVGYSVHAKPNDTTTLIPHLEELKEQIGRLPHNIIADGGYGSEENYAYLERNHLGNYVKYNYFHAEKKKKFRENIYRTENLPYDEETNTYTCPAGKKLVHHRTVKTRSDNNYLKTEELYRCEDCTFCTQAASCKKTEKNRQIRVSHPLKKYRMQANENLCSETGKRLRSQRVVEVEQTFGRLKGCWGFRRFLLRGKEKVKIEWGLLAIAHNITKIALEKST